MKLFVSRNGNCEEAVTLGHILLTDAQNTSKYSTDAHRHLSKLWGLDAEMRGVPPGKEPGGAAFPARVCAASGRAP